MAYVSTGVRGLPMPRSRNWSRGLGAASCPSMQQLLGVVDLSDPCQASLSASGDTVVGPSVTGMAAKPTCWPGDVATQQADGSWLCVTPPGGASASGLMAWFQANPMAGLGLGAAVSVLLLGAMGGRK